jgi:alpha-ketoglutarate-dependent taurine dioxygenase
MRPRWTRFWKREPEYPSAQEIFAALDANGWHAGRASRALGIGRATLWRRLHSAGISLRKQKKKVWSEFWFNEKLEQYRARQTAGRQVKQFTDS